MTPRTITITVTAAAAAAMLALAVAAGCGTSKAPAPVPAAATPVPVTGGPVSGVDPADHRPAAVAAIAAAAGCHVALTEMFAAVGAGMDATVLADSLGTPVLSLEPWGVHGDRTGWDLAATIDGSHDRQYRAIAARVAAHPGTVWIRFAHEMNGTWYPWGRGGGTTAQYVTAWRHVVHLFRAAGVRNALWLWSPNIERDGVAPFSPYWPGADVVDLVGLTGYGTPGERDPEATFGRSLVDLRALSMLPVVLTEVSAQPGPDRLAWVRGFGPFLARHGEIAAFLWVQRNGHAQGARYDWRFDSTAADLAAFRSALSTGGVACG